MDMQSAIQQVPEKPFAANRCADGWEVICTKTGHPVTNARPSMHSANGIAVTLNRLQASGDRKAFARALGAHGDA